MDNETKLVTIPQGEDFSELTELSKKEYESALRNLLKGTTPKEDFPGGVLPRRPIGKGIDVDYVPVWWFIKQLNSLFGHFWDFEILSHEVGSEQIWVLGKLTVKEPKTGLTVTKTSFGGSKMRSKENPGIDIGDDLKSAASDSLKKAATLLGFAADVYGRREMLEQASPIAGQLKTLYKVAKDKHGWDKEKTDDYCMKEFGEEPEHLESIKVLSLVVKIRDLGVKEE